MIFKIKRKFLVFFFIFFLVFIFFILIYYIFFQTKFLKVNEIEIKNLTLINKDLILNSLIKEIIKNNFLKGLIGPDHLFFWWGIESKKIIDNLIYFKDFKIKTYFIDKKVELVFFEREVLGIYCVINKDCYFFDKNGIIYQKAPIMEGGLVLKIVDENNRNLILGQKIFSNLDYFNNILLVYQTLQENNFLVKKIVIKNLKFKEFNVILNNNLIFKFSLEEIPQDFGKILNQLKLNFNFNFVKEYLDFRIENRIYYK